MLDWEWYCTYISTTQIDKQKWKKKKKKIKNNLPRQNHIWTTLAITTAMHAVYLYSLVYVPLKLVFFLVTVQ